jgi:hypothetical protein
MTHKFSILWEAMPKEDREEVDRNVARILAELDKQEQQRTTPSQNKVVPVKQPLIAAHAKRGRAATAMDSTKDGPAGGWE